MLFAEVIVDVVSSNVDKVFDYRIPDSFLANMQGYRVLVPFGARQIEGYVMKVKNLTDLPSEKVKDIIKPLDEYPVLLPEIIKLIYYMKEKLYLRLIDGIRLSVPSQVRSGIKDKLEKILTLNEEKAVEYLSTISKRQKNIPLLIAYIRECGKCKSSEISAKFGSNNVRKLIDNGVLGLEINRINRFKMLEKVEKKVELSDLQKNAMNEICESTTKPIVLFGVTGSGKTEVYMNVIEKMLNEGKTAIMLVPEISLTPQMVRIFNKRFGDSVAVLHSALSVGEKRDEWLRIYRQEAKIVVGARSAIFAPIRNLGAIIIDEEHDNSYLSENNPRYFTHNIAKFRANCNSCPLVLGSATPSIDTFFRAKTHEYNLVEMPIRINQKPMPKIHIVDMKMEYKNGNSSILSATLLEKIDNAIKNNNHVILFINRRGFSSYLICRECAYIPKCTECDANLVYYKSENILKCHYCGKKFKALTKCPNCGSNSIKLGATGTQQIVELLQQHFGDVSIFRLDNDSVKAKDSYNRILSEFGATKPAILVGTQMVTKGHDFPSVSLVGIVDADISLFNYSYKASEITFQLMTQVAGRAGRSDVDGEVVLQTYVPCNPVYLTSANYDYFKFYDKEINLRETTKFPPFAKIVRVLLTSENDELVRDVTHKLILKLKNFRIKYGNKFFFLEAMRSPVNKIKNKNRYQVVLRFANEIEDEVLQKIYEILDTMKDNKLSVFVENNPNSLS